MSIEIPQGAYGIWSIPKLKINLPVYFKPDQAHLQEIIDNKESALIDPWVNAYRIVDHFGSVGLEGKGEWNIQSVMPLAVAYMLRPDGKYKYECYMTAVADVKPYGYMVNGRLVTPVSSKDILNACCVGCDSTKNFIAVFKYMRKL